MKKISIIYILIPLIAATIAYFSSNNFIIPIIVFVLFITYFFLLFMRRYEKHKKEIACFKSCFRFINNFIISLSIKLTSAASLESVSLSMDDDFKEEFMTLDHMNSIEKLTYLKKYYHFHIYELFLNIIQLYEERGGNILDMSNYLLEEGRNQFEYMSKVEGMALRKWVEFSVLWLLSLAIMVLLRFALSQFFDLIAKQLLYQGAIVAVFVFALLSVEILARKSFSIDVKGFGEKHE